MLEIFNNKQKRELGKWGQWGNLSAELFPGVPELSVSQSKINVNENYNCTCICKELLSLQNLSAGVKCQYWQISSAVFCAVLYYSDSKLKELGCCAQTLLVLNSVFFGFFFFFWGGSCILFPSLEDDSAFQSSVKGDGIQPESLLYVLPAALLLFAAFKPL